MALVSLDSFDKREREKTHLALGKHLEDGLLDVVGVVGEAHMPQHHQGGKEQGRGVRELLARNIGSATVDGLEDGALVTNVTGRSQSETTDQTSAHVGQNVTVQVGHDEHLVVVRQRVGDHLQARVVQELSVELNVGKVLGDVAGSREEQTVGHLHDGGLVHSAHLLAANVAGVLEGIAQDALRGLAGDELDALHDTVDNDVLDARVLALGVLTDKHRVHIVVGGLVALDAAARAHVGEEVEGTAESQVERDVALADGGRERALERDKVAGDAVDGLVGDDRLAVLQAGRDVDGLPLDGNVGGAVDVLDRLCDFRTDTVTLDECHRVLSVVALGAVELCDLGSCGVVSRLHPISSYVHCEAESMPWPTRPPGNIWCN